MTSVGTTFAGATCRLDSPTVPKTSAVSVARLTALASTSDSIPRGFDAKDNMANIVQGAVLMFTVGSIYFAMWMLLP